MFITDLIRIKKTKFLELYWDTELKGIWIYTFPVRSVIAPLPEEKTFIPLVKTLSLIRGLLSGHQKYYRNHAKKNKS